MSPISKNASEALPNPDDPLPEIGPGEFLTLYLQNPLSFRLLFYSAVYMDNCDGDKKPYSIDDAKQFVARYAPQNISDIAILLSDFHVLRQDAEGRPLPLLAEEPYIKVKEHIEQQLGRQPREFVEEIESFFQPASDSEQPHAFIDKVWDIWSTLQRKGELEIHTLWSKSCFVLSNMGGQRSILVEVTTASDDRGSYNVICNAYTEAQADRASVITGESPLVRLACAPRFGQRARDLAVDPKINVVLWDAVSVWEMSYQMPTSSNRCRRLTRLLPEFLVQVGLFAFSSVAWNRIRVHPRK